MAAQRPPGPQARPLISGRSLRRELVTLPVVAILAIGFAAAAALYFVMRSYSLRQAEAYRSEQLVERRQGLKDMVDTAFAALQTQYESARESATLEKQFGPQLMSVIDAAESIVRRHLRPGLTGARLEEAQAQALAGLNQLRYGARDGAGLRTGYVWVNDMSEPTPRMVMHPMQPSLDGEILDSPSFHCALGNSKTNLFVAFREVCKEHGEGFVDYLWPKPRQSVPQPKLSYVRLIPEWGWVLGTGVYVDDALQQAKAQALEQMSGMRYGAPESDEGARPGYFWVNDVGRPYPTMVMHPVKPELDGKELSFKEFNVVRGTGENLFRAFVDAVHKDRDGDGRAEGDGYVEYLWPKPGRDAPQPKLSYVRLYEPLGWVVGTGLYIDDIDEAVAVKQASLDRQIHALLLWFVPLLLAGCGALAALIRWRAKTRMVAPLQCLVTAIDKLAQGDAAGARALSEGCGSQRTVDTLKQVHFAMARMARGLESRSATLIEVGQGNLDQRVELASTSDTLGMGVRRVVEDLGDVVRLIKGNSDTVGRSAQGLEQISARMTEETHTMTKQSGALAGISDEVSEELTAVAANAQQMSATVASVASAIEQLAASVAETGHRARRGEEISGEAVATARTAGERIQALGAGASEIGQVTEVIKGIARQTNLLALNATIEAASAGEAGRAFAVVAKEIKDLASRSAKAAQQIGTRIGNVQTHTEEAIRFIADVSAIIDKLTESMTEIATAVDHQKRTAADIAHNVQALDVGAGQVAVSMSRAAQRGSEMSSSVGDVDHAVSATRRGVDQIHDSASQLSRVATELARAVDRFRLRGEEDPVRSSAKPAGLRLDGPLPRLPSRGKTQPRTKPSMTG